MNSPFEIEKGVVSTVFEMSPARASQATSQKPAMPDKPRIAALGEPAFRRVNIFRPIGKN